MRESLLEANSRPRKKKKSRTAIEPVGERRRGLFAFMRMSPGRAFFLAGMIAVCGGVLVNAAYLQSDKHPAPFFAKNVAPVESKHAAVHAARPSRQTTPVQDVASQSNRWKVEQPVLPPVRSSLPKIVEPEETQAPAVNVPRTEHAPQPGPARDLIGSLLSGGLETVPRPPAKVPNTLADNGSDRSGVLAMQKALVKLGYKLDVDGIAGPATRSALEKFQRANKLQPTGQAESRTLRLLASRARVTIPN